MLSDHITQRLDEMTAQAEALSRRLEDPEVAANHVEFTKVNRELASLRRTVDLYAAYREALAEMEEAKGILADGSSDAELRELAEMQLPEATVRLMSFKVP